MSGNADGPDVSRTPDSGGHDDRTTAEQDLLAEIHNLTRLLAEHERATDQAFNEMRRAHTALGWRAQRRFEKVGDRLLRNPILRQPYRMVRRAFEIWVDEGLSSVFTFAARKIGYAIQGRSLIVDDHTWTPPDPDDYQVWIQQQTPTAEAYAAMRVAIATLPDAPLVSVLMASDRDDSQRVRRTMASLQAQVYDRWELSPPFDSLALAQGTQVHAGSVVAVVNPGDVLAPEALFEAVKRLAEDPAADIVYSDQDMVDAAGHRTEPFFKPDWDPELLLATNYLGPFTVVRRPLIDEVGGLRPPFGAGQVYDLMLRASERATRIAHVPKILCHLGPREMTREGIVAHHAAGRDERRAIEDALVRRQRPGRAEPIFTSRGPRCYATRFELARRPLVSIIVPTRNQAALLKTTIDSILAGTDYGPYEIVVVDNGSTDEDALAYLAALGPPCQVHRWPHPFNYSAINNFGVSVSKGEQLLFLNNDVEVIHRDWLTAMLEYAQCPEVGAVGAKLLFTDGTIQHAGVVFIGSGVAQHAFRWAAKEVLGVPRLADLPRNCSAVTGACMMVSRRVFEEVGGFNEQLRVVLNDVDLCLRIRQRNHEVVYTPHALLYHHEGASRGRLHPPQDEARFLQLWPNHASTVDPYYNPNLTDRREDWSVRLHT
jgi:GT2 family glycosyltransferase